MLPFRTFMRKSVCAATLGLAAALAVPAPCLAAEAPPVVPPGKQSDSRIFGPDETLWNVFNKGGWVMWPILACSVIGLAFFLERAIELRRKRHAPEGFDKDVVHIVDTRGVDAGLAQCLDKQSSLSRVLYAALLRYGTSRQEMEAAVQDEGSRLLFDLRRNARFIGIVSNVAPLLGLLGTVLGLIQAFDQVAAGGTGKTELLASGVAVALLTTAFGLIVAIPLFFMYHYAKGKADEIVREIEERAVDAIITLDRKARRSIRQISDIEEGLETKEMDAARNVPDLDAEFDDPDLERSIKTSVTTPAHMPVVTPPAGTPSKTSGRMPQAGDPKPPRQIAAPDEPLKP